MRAQGERAYVIGRVERREEHEAPLLLDPGLMTPATAD